MFAEVLEIMSAALRTGRFSWFWCSLIFMPKRLIVAKNFDLKKMQFDLRYPKSEKGDILYSKGHYFDIRKPREYVIKRLLENGLQDFILRKRLRDILPKGISIQSIQLPIEDTLNYDKENYQILYNEISRVEVKKLSKWRRPWTSEIKITTREKEHKFTTGKPVTSEHVLDMLNITVKDKIEIK